MAVGLPGSSLRCQAVEEVLYPAVATAFSWLMTVHLSGQVWHTFQLEVHKTRRAVLGWRLALTVRPSMAIG